MTTATIDYALRRIDPDLWEAVKARAASEGRTIRWVLISALRVYAERGFGFIEASTVKERER
jgi:ABC-type Fe3+ transport system permease subunit